MKEKDKERIRKKRVRPNESERGVLRGEQKTSTRRLNFNLERVI